jgi:hypothetical protein
MTTMDEHQGKVTARRNAPESLKAAREHYEAGNDLDACTMAKIAVHQFTSGTYGHGVDWARFARLTPRAQFAFSGIVRTVWTSDAKPTREDAAFCLTFANEVCQGGRKLERP